MASYNKVLLMGNLTKDPELRYTPQGTAVANLRMAINRKFRSKDNELKEEVCFITAVVWSKQAETCNQYLRKGSALFVEGSLQSRSWEDNTGAKKSVIEVRAERVQFMGSPSGVSNKQPSGAREQGSGNTELSAGDGSTEAVWLAESEDETHEG